MALYDADYDVRGWRSRLNRDFAYFLKTGAFVILLTSIKFDVGETDTDFPVY